MSPDKVAIMPCTDSERVAAEAKLSIPKSMHFLMSEGIGVLDRRQ
jgi:hypothetical protein